MTTKKISELTTASTPLSGNELAVVVQSGTTKKVPVSAFGSAILGNLTVTNTTISTVIPDDPIIVSVSMFGTAWWFNVYNVGWAEGVCYDAQGNIYAVYGNGNGLTKFDPAGLLLWQKNFVTGNTWESVTADSTGNVYLAISNIMNLPTLVKLDSNGNELWQVQIESIDNVLWNVCNVKTDASDNIYLTAEGTNEDIRYLFKFDPSGNLLWQQKNLNSQGGQGHGIGTACPGIVVVGQDPVTYLDDMGLEVWQVGVDSPGGVWNNLDCDADGNVYVVGTWLPNKFAVQKLNNLGEAVWLSTTEELIGNYGVVGVVYDPGTTSVLVTGVTSGDDLYIASLAADTGNLNWINIFHAPSPLSQWNNWGNNYIAVHGDLLVIAGSMQLNSLILQVPTSGQGLGTYGDYSYLASSVTLTTTTGTSAPNISTNQPGSVTITSGTLTIVDDIRASTRTLFGPGGGISWQFLPTPNNGILQFPDGSQQTTAFAPGVSQTFGNITANTLTVNSTNITIGQDAGQITQGEYSVAIGSGAGNSSQGESAIAIGNQAGTSNQANNSIVINATGSALENTTTGTTVIAPMRAVTGGVAPSGFYPTYYNPTTGEIIVVTP